eukprot:TRINITY_DN1171_c1_g2_i1.p1 TRINITY_DN1171_c1_g2~~TRINITY_DN1171_c1_g2_i1.p1  ORF type:complete len:371 (-),score=101.07 TRINITY_DN1171_c1_g2_i1:2409-3413(-)
MRYVRCTHSMLCVLAAPPSLVKQFSALSALRCTCTRLRDAVDSSFTHVDLSVLSQPHIHALLLRVLPRFVSMFSLTIPPHAVTPSLTPAWVRYFDACERFTPALAIRELTFIDAPPYMCQLFAAAFKPSLRRLSTGCMHLLHALAHNNIHTLHLVMDDINASALQLCQPRHLYVLYRRGMSAQQARSLQQVLALMPRAPELSLRVHRLCSSEYVLFKPFTNLTRLALFDSCRAPAHAAHQNAMRALTQCQKLRELRLEWVAAVDDDDLQLLARAFGARLSRLMLWHCERVSDRGLHALATLCPNAQVELRFEREQFGAHSLALFGDRVQWASAL